MIAPWQLVACFYVPPFPLFLPSCVKKILNSRLLSTLLPLFSLSHTSRLCWQVGRLCGGCKQPRFGGTQWVLSLLMTLPRRLRAHCRHAWLGLTPHLTLRLMCGEGGRLGGGAPDPSVRTPLWQGCLPKAPLQSKGSSIPLLVHNQWICIRLPHLLFYVNFCHLVLHPGIFF